MLLLLALLVQADDAPKDPPVDPAASPSTSVQFTVTEGTWTNLDVSPDGQTLAFDLLGHIYTVPLQGGRATALTTGHSWNMHPRYSPDGDALAFTSDRGGGDNIWVMDADGAHPRAISEEKMRLVSQPDWTPDGRFIYGRKHFTGNRSLGTGEIWAWEVSGDGDGHAWTEKDHIEADINEPHVDPLGEYLYWTSTGPYEYNRNIYQGIYKISRKNLKTGETNGVAGGPGGAIRPQVSPDGKTLGYLRRNVDGQRTEIVLRDLNAGTERVLFSDLDRDQQETWSIHGTYPTWDWQPDNSGVVIAFDGQPHRIDLDGNATAIPIEVEVNRPVVGAVRQPHAASPLRTQARVVRWASLSPSGDRLLFVAVGRVWIKPLDGEAVAVSSTDVLAFAPSWAPKGDAIVYTTWDDVDGGMVWHQPVSGDRTKGDAEALGDGPDLYTGPSFSSDGQRVVWVRGTGVSNRGMSASHESSLKLQWRDLDSDELHDAGTVHNLAWGVHTPRPRFSADGQRIYVTDTADKETQLVSV
ncbi:MAG: Tol biopolymer transport system component, partial [Kiritimatiellia bacterium]